MKKSTVKVLFMTLGMFVVAACSDGADESGGEVDGAVVEKLETNLLKIVVDTPKDLETVTVGQQEEVMFSITNKSTEDMSLRITGYRNRELTEFNITGSCKLNTSTSRFTQGPGETCTIGKDLVMAVTAKGSPFAIYLKDRAGDTMAVVIKYTF